jgi:hypothetical protein
MSNRERRNKRESEELERIPEPKNKKRKGFISRNLISGVVVNK